MHPRTVKMAAEVASQFSGAQIDDYGNIILNGYLEVVPNTTNKKAWQYQETGTAPVNLPSLTEVRPAYKGWTTNYAQYYTELRPNDYNQEPGSPTMFEYIVHSRSDLLGPIVSATYVTYGSNYVPGTYVGIATTSSGVGFGATVDFTVDFAGNLTSFGINAGGSDYALGETVAPIPGAGQGGTEPIEFHVTSITATKGGEAKYAQPPVRRGNALVPQADSVLIPPIGNLNI